MCWIFLDFEVKAGWLERPFEEVEILGWLRTRKHWCGWEGAASESDVGCGNQHCCLRIGAVSEFFFGGFVPTGLRFTPTWLRFTPIRADSARIKSYRPKRPKKAKIGLESCRNSQNRLWMRPKHPKSVLPQFYSECLLLLLCFLFCFVLCLVFLAFFLCFVNQGHSNVFFKNILIVKIYRKYK